MNREVEFLFDYGSPFQLSRQSADQRVRQTERNGSEATAQMLHGLSQRQAVPETLVSLIFEEGQGYPLFVEEVYRQLIEEGKVFDAAGQFRAEIDIAEDEVPENVRLIDSTLWRTSARFIAAGRKNTSTAGPTIRAGRAARLTWSGWGNSSKKPTHSRSFE
jgi:hypothetical protein